MMDKGKREQERLSPLRLEGGSQSSCCLSLLPRAFVLTEVKVWQRCAACWISLEFIDGLIKRRTRFKKAHKKSTNCFCQHFRSFVTIQPRRAPENLSFHCPHRWPPFAFCSCSFRGEENRLLAFISQKSYLEITYNNNKPLTVTMKKTY